MSFILRQIMRRAGGGADIVRERILPSAEIVIGRGADCDIQLNDLVAALHHARLQELDGGHVSVEALGPAEIEIDGVVARRSEVSAAARPRIAIGSHILELSTGADGEIVVTVSRIASSTEGSGTTDLHSVFSLSGVLNKRRASYLLLMSIILLCLVWPVYAFLHSNSTTVTGLRADKQWSSGPLSRGHRFLEKNCNACHQRAFVSVRDSACLVCHQVGLKREVMFAVKAQGSPFAPIAASDHAPPARLISAMPGSDDIGRRISRGISDFFNHPQDRCASCHTEHVGATKQQASAIVPALPSSAQVRISCTGCHGSMSQRMLDTKLGDVRNWSQHPEFRPLISVSPGPIVQLARKSLSHRLLDRADLFFSHQQHLSKTGGVTRMAERLGLAGGYGKPLACANCHRADGAGFRSIKMTRDCAACHSLAYATKAGGVLHVPHGKPAEVVAALENFYAGGGPAAARNPDALFAAPPSVAGGRAVVPAHGLTSSQIVERGVRAAFSRGGACYGCHTILPPLNPASLLYRIAPVHLIQRYLPSGDFDHDIREHKQDVHGQPICTQCHKAETSRYSRDVLIPRISECRACHGRSKPATTAPAGTNCSECHAYHRPGTSARLRSDNTLTF